MATLAMEEEEEMMLPQSFLSEEDQGGLWGELVRTKSVGMEVEGEVPSDCLKTEMRKNEKYVIGRDAGKANICIKDPHVSSKHCAVFRDDKDQVWVEDYSLSGTFVNGVKVPRNSKKRLTNGDTITLLHASAAALTSPKASVSSTTSKKGSNNFYEFVFRDLTPKQGPCKGEINAKYEILEEIGAGSFATVRKGVNRKTQEEVAVKIVLRRQFEFEPAKWKDQLKEIDMLKRVDHESCVRLLDTYEVPDALYIVMEFVSGGELFDRILKHGKLQDDEARVFTRRLLEAVQYLHLQGIVHRDLKPENILCVHCDVNCLHVKVADFGVARLVDGAGCKTVTGSMAYLAPEVLDRKHTLQGLGSYAYEVDMWSVGVIVYVCLLARLPFHDVQESGDLNQAVVRMFQGNELQGMTPLAKEFLSGLLTMDCNKRFSAAKALDHPWVANSRHCAKLEVCHPGQCSMCLEGGKPSPAQSKRSKPNGNGGAPPVPLFSQE
ncbi:hypothetical protein BASA81_004753 [Batrachochytrium salamandrivorans]|nr:hypothetical protein BASA81_004753 [Batrachochytrium salamandrivorans]